MSDNGLRYELMTRGHCFCTFFVQDCTFILLFSLYLVPIPA